MNSKRGVSASVRGSRLCGSAGLRTEAVQKSPAEKARALPFRMTPLLLEPTTPNASMQHMMEELWPLLEYAIHLTAKGKAAKHVLLEFLGDAREDVLSLAMDNELMFNVRSPGGMCAASQAATEHWLHMATLLLAPQLDPLLASHGLRFVRPLPSLNDALARSPQTPLVVLKNVLHGVSAADEVFSDDGLGVSDITKLKAAERALIASTHASGQCACPMCVSLRKKLPAIDVAKLRRQRASAQVANSVGMALRHPAEVRTLDLHERHDLGDTLDNALGSLVNLEELILYGASVRALPPSISSLQKLRILDVSGTALRALPELASLERLRASWTDIAALPESFSKLALRDFEISFRLTPPPEGYLPHLECMSSLTRIQIFCGALGREGDFDAETKAAFAASERASHDWAAALEAFDFSKLTQLTHLTLWNFPLKRIPPSLAQCSQLVHLDLRGTSLPTLDVDLRQLPLMHLVLEGAVGRIPDWVCEMQTLRHLSFTGTFETIPENLFALTQLEGLGLNGKLRSLPSDIEKLAALKYLWLWNNPLETLPSTLARLPLLEMLGLLHVPNAKPLAAAIGLSSKVRVLT